jgi:hypothetical protein
MWFASREEDHAVRWESQADDGWKIVETVGDIDAPIDDATGLPMRTPGALLMPGSIAPPPWNRRGGPAEEDAAVQEPVVIRNRLSSYRDGVNRARSFGNESDVLASSSKWSLSRSG